jgi:MinD superfamily P-loop ATPase
MRSKNGKRLRYTMIISVASGKGGTGKTLVATSLALSLKDIHNVQILDCDVEEPNDHIFIKPDITRSESVPIPVPKIDEEKCTHCGKCAEVCAYNAIAVLGEYVLTFPELCHGCGACSYLCPEKAIAETPHDIGVIETGEAEGVNFGHGKLSIGQAMAPPVIRKVKELIDKDKLVIIDASPGTSCPVVEAIKDSDFCLLVTEPTPFGLNDLVLAVETVSQLDLPYGIVLNRAGVGDGKTEEYCRKEYIPILLTIPLDTNIAAFYSQGIPLVEGMPDYKKSFIGLYKKIGEMVNERSTHPQR